MNEDPKSFTQIVRDGVEKACKEFTARIEPMGFSRTKKMLWTRRREHTVDFVYFFRHGSTYGAPRNASVDIRVHFAIRVLNDSHPGTALNGPESDPTRLRAGRYHLRFNAETGSTYDRCVDDLVRFVKEQGEPWFLMFADPEKLLSHQETPLKDEAKDFLRAALAGQSDSLRVIASLKLMGIKG